MTPLDNGYAAALPPRAARASAIEEGQTVGVAAVSIRRIARRAGVSHAALAYQFGDKRGIFTAVATEGFHLQAEMIGSAATGPDGFLRGGHVYIRSPLPTAATSK
ncbi:TetR/AcrR family transcriptional regulator [Mycobacterium sp. Dal123C01]|uniref:TetR/AcrR family transcriptional regulator n=1 Tax=Mycobacterium sp. Dal123C01 TaxID=3457577 RepID=UPI00403E5746